MPSPPMPDASGSTTPRANDTAIAASTMLPPCTSTRAPASLASRWPETTTASCELTGARTSGCRATRSSTTRVRSSALRAVAACGRNWSRKRLPGRSGRPGLVVEVAQQLPRAVERQRPPRGVGRDGACDRRHPGVWWERRRDGPEREPGPAFEQGRRVARGTRGIAVVGRPRARHVGEQQHPAVGRPGRLRPQPRDEDGTLHDGARSSPIGHGRRPTARPTPTRRPRRRWPRRRRGGCPQGPRPDGTRARGSP